MIKTDRIAFVGDPHLDSTTPSSRIDDYAQSSLEKLEELKNVCIRNEVKVVVFLGDMFNKHDQSNTYINRVMSKFRDFQSHGLCVYSITGNHDISYEKIDTLERAPLKMLYTSGLVKHLSEEVLDVGPYKVGVYGLDYPDEPIKVSELETRQRLNVLAAHRFFNYAFNDPHNFTVEDCVELGYNVYALGHDHMKYERVDLANAVVLRPGSFMRTSSHSYNLEREISIDIVIFSGTDAQPIITNVRKTIPSKPASAVFSEAVMQRSIDRGVSTMEEELSLRVENLLQQMEATHSEGDIFKVLDDVCKDEEVKACVTSYLNNGGYYRHEES